jgi:hypothetical protein
MQTLEQALEPIWNAKRTVGEAVSGLSHEALKDFLEKEDQAFRSVAREARDVDLSWLTAPMGKAA